MTTTLSTPRRDVSASRADAERSATARQARSLILGIVLLLVLNAGVIIAGALSALWGVLAVANFLLLAWIASLGHKLVKGRVSRFYEIFLAILFPVVIIVGWQVLSQNAIINPRWFPPPTEVIRALWEITVTPEAYSTYTLLGEPWRLPEFIAAHGFFGGIGLMLDNSQVWATLSRVIVGFVLGAIPGVVIGAVMGMSRTVRALLDPTMSAIYVLPKISIFPLIMLIFGDPFGEAPKYAVVALTVFFLVLFNTMAGVLGIEKIYHDVGRNYGANSLQAFFHIVVPGSMPMIFAGMRIALGSALIVIIAIEFLRAKSGVGYITFYYWEVMNTPKMYAGLLVTMIMGVLLTLLLQWLERSALPWRRLNRESTRAMS